jgi:DNA-binding XRE family transcriptional regulator
MDKPWERPSHIQVTSVAAIGLAQIASWVKMGRREAHMTQQHVENVSGVDQTVISRLENGRLNSIRLVRLAAVIGAIYDPRPRPSRWD